MKEVSQKKLESQNMHCNFLFSDVLYSETVGSPPSFYLNYTTRKHVQSYTVTAKVIIQGVIADKSGMVEYTLLDTSSRIYKPTTCPLSSTRKRRKRMVDINQ